MKNSKQPKWELAATIHAARNTHALATKHLSSLNGRIAQPELDDLETKTDQLETIRVSISETLVNQKSKTLGQKQAVKALHKTVSAIRNIVKKDKTATPEIAKAYGVGEPMTKSVSNIQAAANIVLKAYEAFADWSHAAGIIDADRDTITSLLDRLDELAGKKDDAMSNRKNTTFDKNIVQREVEDEVSRISAIGVHVYINEDAAVAQQFEELIPSKGGTGNGNTPPETPTEPT